MARARVGADNHGMKISVALASTLPLALPALLLHGACSATQDATGFGGSSTGDDTSSAVSGGGDFGSGGFNPGTGGGGPTGDIKTCEQAAQAKSYIGCDFWPTVVQNNVWSIFDYAVVVANAGDQLATVTVERNGAGVASATIAPDQLAKLYLPWVPELKGPDFDECTAVLPPSGTVRVNGGAYHLVSDRPVTVYQFNALEYGPAGGPPGKDWSQCPASACGLECFSYSNDASLLLPSTAMTGNYRVAGLPGWPIAAMSPYIAITGTAAGTNVKVKTAANAQIQGGGGLQAIGGGQEVTFTLGAGDVVEMLGTPDSDLSGSLVQADKPVQVIFGVPCIFIPQDAPACDHIEESVFPAETLGKHYFVTVPTGPAGQPVQHVVRIFGNVDGTTLSYPGGGPLGAPGSLSAGQVVDLGLVSQDFEIVGDHEFSVATFQVGASIVDPIGGLEQRGDPAQSFATTVEQFRVKYVFLAPSDYPVNFVDVVMPVDASVSIDGQPVSATVTPISSGFGVARVQLGPGQNGAHVLESSAPVGIQVLGYGSFTSYQYPGGSDLKAIAPPPPQ
jgi:hypothetical protein